MMYYYLDVDDNTVFEQKDNYYGTIKRLGKSFVSRNSKGDSYKFVYYRELFTESEISKIKSLGMNKTALKTIELSKDEIFTDLSTRKRFGIAWEKEHNTQIWKDNKHRIKSVSKEAKEKELLRKSWLQIYAILQETGYDKLYEDDITRVANVVRKELKLD